MHMAVHVGMALMVLPFPVLAALGISTISLKQIMWPSIISCRACWLISWNLEDTWRGRCLRLFTLVVSVDLYFTLVQIPATWL